MNPSMPDAHVLLEHREFLRRLARGILHDGDAADDVAQEALVEAMRGRPRNPRGWLGKVARRLALTRRRAEERRALRERAAARPEALPSAAEGVARLELQRRVVDAVLSLDEPYRSVVVHRFFYDVGPVEIAKRLQASVETVRTRLRRALEMLRARLDASHGREAWSMALLALAAPRKLPLGGLLAMSVKSKLVLASLLVLAALGVSALTHQDAAPPRAVTPQHEEQAQEPEVAVPPAPLPVDFAAIDRDRDVHGVVVDAEGNAVVNADVRVIRYPAMGIAAGLSQLEAEEGPGTKTASDGTFALRVERGEEVDLRVKASGFVELQRRWCPAGGKVRIVMRKGVSLRVRAVGPDGQPLAGAHVVAFKGRAPEMEAAGLYVYLEGTTDAQGACVLRGLVSRELQVIAWHADVDFPRPGTVKLPEEGEAEVQLTAERGRDVTGRVTDAETGVPVPDAVVTPYPIVLSLAKSVRTDSDGRYRYGGMGREKILCVHAKGYARGLEDVLDRDRIDYALVRGATLTGVVRDEQGAAIAGAFVGARASDRTEFRETLSDALGRYQLDDLSGDARRLVVVKAGYARASVPIETASIDVVLREGRRLEGRVIGLDGAPVEGCVVTAVEAVATPAGAAAPPDGAKAERHTDDLGRFRFADLPSGVWSVRAASGERDASRSLTIGSADVLDFELRFEEPRTDPAREFTVQVVDDAGRPVPGVPVRSMYQPRGKTTDAQGRVTLEMKAGVHLDQVSIGRIDPRYAQPPVVSYRLGEGEIRIVLHDAAPVSGRVLLAGEPLAYAAVFASGPDRFTEFAPTGADGSFTLRVPAGARVDLSLSGQVKNDMQPIFGDLKGVAAGSEGLVLEARRVALDRTLAVRVVTPEGEGVPGMLIFPGEARGWRPGKEPPKTDAQGRCELTGLPAAEFSVMLQSNPPAPWAPPKSTLLPAPLAAQEVVFTFREATPIRGVVVGPDGAAVQTGIHAWRGAERAGFAITRKDGTFTLYVAAEDAGPLRLESWGATGLRGEVAGVAPGAEGVTIRLQGK